MHPEFKRQSLQLREKHRLKLLPRPSYRLASNTTANAAVQENMIVNNQKDSVVTHSVKIMIVFTPYNSGQ
jgi:hypothetical protein